jgi:hypothetical protein
MLNYQRVQIFKRCWACDFSGEKKAIPAMAKKRLPMMPVPRIDSAATWRSCWSSVNHGENGLIYHFKYLNMFINSSILEYFAGYLRLACEWDSYGLSVVKARHRYVWSKACIHKMGAWEKIVMA